MRKTFGFTLFFLLFLFTTPLLFQSTALSPPRNNSTPALSQKMQPTGSDALWIQIYGGAGSEWGHSVIECTGGGFALAGHTNSLGSGDRDAWLIRTDANGNHQWNQTFGGADRDESYFMVECTGGGFALAGFTYTFGAGASDAYLIRTDSTGNQQWTQTFGGPARDETIPVVECSDGGFALGGYTYSFGAGGSDVWLLRTDSNGNHLWNQTFGGANNDEAWGMAPCVDGGFVLVGITESYGAGDSDIYVVRTDSNGALQWNQSYGGSDEEWGVSIAELSNGDFIISGRTESFGAGFGDAWLIRTDSTGNALWNRTIGGTLDDMGQGVIECSDGGFALICETQSHGAGSYDAWLLRIDEDGNTLWSRIFGESGSDEAFVVTESSTGDYVITGSTESYGSTLRDIWLIHVSGTAPTTPPAIPGFPWLAIITTLTATLSLTLLQRRRRNTHNK